MPARCTPALLWVSSAWSCSCLNEVNFCEPLRRNEVVFAGTVTGPATLRVEEIFHSLVTDTRTMRVDPGAGSGCGLDLESGERYVIFGRPLAGMPGLVFAGVGSNSWMRQRRYDGGIGSKNMNA